MQYDYKMHAYMPSYAYANIYLFNCFNTITTENKVTKFREFAMHYEIIADQFSKFFFYELHKKLCTLICFVSFISEMFLRAIASD